MGDYGIKISKPGYDVKTASPHQLVFSSKYQTLKIKQQGSGTITDSGGRTHTIAHNLGYVPMFLVHTMIDEFFGSFYGNDPSDLYIDPFGYPAEACNVDRNIIAWADTTNLYIKAQDDFAWEYFYTNLTADDYSTDDNTGCWGSYSYVGNYSVYGVEDAAFRFQNVTLNKGASLVKAELGFYLAVRHGSATVPVKIYGIAEDNCGSFPCGPSKSRTSAYKTEACDSGLAQGTMWFVGVKECVEEVLNRSGWSSGNHLGLILMDNGTPSGSEIGTGYGYDYNPYCSLSCLRVLRWDSLLSYKYTIFLNQINP